MTQIVLLIRHAQSSVQHERLAGWTPGIDLSEEGVRQAKALGERLAAVKLVAAYSSPLDRCVRTAEVALAGRTLALRTDEDLGEVRYGRWQGKTYKVLAKTPLWRTVQFLPSQATFPGGESIRDLQYRAVGAVERIRTAHPKGVVAVFSHADTIKTVVAHYLAMHLDLFQRIVVGNAAVTAFGFGMGAPRLIRLNDTGAYADLMPTAPKPKPKR